MLEKQIRELAERQHALAVYLKRYAMQRRRCGFQRMNSHAMQVVRQWQAMDAQLKRLCAIALDGQRLQLGMEGQLAEQFNQPKEG